MRKLILPAAGVLLLFVSRAHAGLVTVILIGAGVPVALLLAGAVAWLTWRAVRDSLPPPALRELPPPPRQYVRAGIKVIRGELKDGQP